MSGMEHDAVVEILCFIEATAQHAADGGALLWSDQAANPQYRDGFIAALAGCSSMLRHAIYGESMGGAS